MKVKHNENALLIDTEMYIEKLFNERLDSKFSYHNFEHTKNVVSGIEILCKAEEINEETKTILLLAGWFHDAGYVDGCENHEKKSIEIALEFLKDKKISADIQEKVTELIMATTYNYTPKNLLEKIIKDADNVHLANENYPNTLEQLREEWEVSINKTYCNTDWFVLNIDFLKNHTYYTKFAREKWQNLKEINLKTIEEKLQNQL